MLVELLWSLLAILPYVALTVAGVLLWRRYRSTATSAVAMGFAVALLDQLIGVASWIQFLIWSRIHSDSAIIIPHPHLVGAISHAVALVGLLAASAGLLWHVTHADQSASPNNRWRGP